MEFVSSEELIQQLNGSREAAQTAQYSPKLSPMGLKVVVRKMPLDEDDSRLELAHFRRENQGDEYFLPGVDGTRFWQSFSRQVKLLDDVSKSQRGLLERRPIDVGVHGLHSAVYMRMREFGLDTQELIRQAGIPESYNIRALLSFTSLPDLERANRLARVLQLEPEKISSNQLGELRDVIRHKWGNNIYNYSEVYGRSAFFHTSLARFLREGLTYYLT